MDANGHRKQHSKAIGNETEIKNSRVEITRLIFSTNYDILNIN